MKAVGGQMQTQMSGMHYECYVQLCSAARGRVRGSRLFRTSEPILSEVDSFETSTIPWLWFPAEKLLVYYRNASGTLMIP